MPSRKRAVPASREEAGSLPVALGLFVALALPYVLYRADSAEQLRDSKLALQAAGAALALGAVAWTALRRAFPFPAFRTLSAAGRAAAAAIAAALVLSVASGLVNSARVDPLTAAAVLSPLALALAGASRDGARLARSALTAVLAAGAVTGLLAAAQRFLGILRLIPVEAQEPRFLAVALIGNPGDVASALVLPALLFWIRATEPRPLRPRLLAAAGLAACLVGLGATESVDPLAAVGAGLLVHTLLDLSARWKPFVAAIVLLAAASAATGAGRRVLVKLDQLRRGETAEATTQRDIGVLAAFEMIRA